MSPVYPISVLFQTLSWHNFPCPGRHTILSIYYCCSWWAWIKGLNTPHSGGMDVSPLCTATCVQGQPTWRTRSERFLPEEQQGLVLEGEGQPGHCGGPKGRKHHVLSSLCPSCAGSWMEQRSPEAARAQSVHQLCASWAAETVQSWGSLCLFTHVASLTRTQRAQPSETIVMYVQLFKLELVFILNQTLGKGSEVLGNQVEGRNSFMLLNTVYSRLVWKDDGPWSGSYSTFSAV